MSNSTFIKGLIACVVAMLGLGVVIGLLNHGTSRPEGVAENWLTDIGDTTRKGVESDARHRAEKIGNRSLPPGLVYPDAEAIDRKSAFADLEVGKAVRIDRDPYGVRVGFRVHARRPEGKTEKIQGVIHLEQLEDGKRGWGVVELQLVDPVAAGLPALPSDGGPPPSSAPASLWLGGLVGAALIGVLTTSLIKLAGRGTPVVAAPAV